MKSVSQGPIYKDNLRCGHTDKETPVQNVLSQPVTVH